MSKDYKIPVKNFEFNTKNDCSKDDYYKESRARKIGDLFIGFGLMFSITFICISIGYFFQLFVNIKYLSTIDYLLIIIAIIVSISFASIAFKKERRFIGYGILFSIIIATLIILTIILLVIILLFLALAACVGGLG